MNDTLTYEAFKYAVITMETQSYQFCHDPAFKPALVLGVTFAINSVIFMSYSGGDKFAQVTRPATIIFVVGGLLSVLTYFIQ